MELAFQSTDSFADGYIEAPDDAHAPPPTGWRRHDTNFHLLVYHDPPATRQVGTRTFATTEHGCRLPAAVHRPWQPINLSTIRWCCSLQVGSRSQGGSFCAGNGFSNLYCKRKEVLSYQERVRAVYGPVVKLLSPPPDRSLPFPTS